MMMRLHIFLSLPLLATLIHPCASFAAPRKGGGFGSAPTASSTGSATKSNKPPPLTAADDQIAEQVARQLFGVCSHLQTDLYAPSWAHVAELTQDDAGGQHLVTTTDISRGDIVSLYPVHSLGLRGSSSTTNEGKKKKKSKNKTKRRRTSDYLVFDSARDGEFFGSRRRTTKYCIDFPAMIDQKELRGQSLFLDANPERELVPGWMGHICDRGTKDKNSNCVAIPIQGVAPLCMIVATQDIAKGETLIRDVTSNEGEAILRDRITESGDIATKKYASEIAELASYTNMAYPAKEANDDEPKEPSKNADEKKEAAPTFKKINLQYPGLQSFHSDPDIYCVDQFLTDEECERVIEKCKPLMAPCVTKDPKTGVVGPDPRRTSTEAMLPQAEAPSIVSKLVKLLDCREDQLEILQVLRYKNSQFFSEHTDGFDGPTTAAGFEDSGRLVTIFMYLNDVRNGGHTEFCNLGFSVAPKKGSAVIHFPASEQLKEDERTLHRGMPAVDEKWLLATWVWQHSRTDPRYAENNLPKLSEDVI